jgi:hypothetical protein
MNMRNFLLISFLTVALGCKKNIEIASLTTTNPFAITNTSAKSGGTITNDFGNSITERGVVWSTSPNPTISLTTKTKDGTGSGSFTSTLPTLNQNTTYYIRAYATNKNGTTYGNEINFKTLNIDISTDLVAYYPFSGNANDISGNSNNGTVMGDVALTTDRFGNSNRAYTFPGKSNSYIDCGTSNSLKISGSITMAAWIYLDGGYINPRVLNFGNEGSGTNYQISMRGNSNVNRYIDGGIAMSNGQGAFFCCGSQGSGVNTPSLSWQHIAFTVNDLGVAKSYLNGKLISTIQGTPVNESNYSNTTLNIGRKNQSAFDAFGGKIDEIRIYKRALTDEQINYLHAENN